MASKLTQSDTIATVSLSWGGVGELPHGYEQGKRQLENTFGVSVIEMSNTLKPAQYLHDNPQARADDLHDFGHSCPTFMLPIGAMAEIDCDNQTFAIVESGVE